VGHHQRNAPQRVSANVLSRPIGIPEIDSKLTALAIQNAVYVGFLFGQWCALGSTQDLEPLFGAYTSALQQADDNVVACGIEEVGAQ
jgi:hypothetical protein